MGGVLNMKKNGSQSSIYKGRITFGDKEYECEIRNGTEYYIDGKTPEEFIKTLDAGYLGILERKGMQVLQKKEPVKN